MTGMGTRMAHPARPCVDSRMESGQYPPREYAEGSTQFLAQMTLQGPSQKALLEGYKLSIEDNFEGDRPRFNPMNASRPQSSMLVNVNDPIQIHLLVEMALSDSEEFEILSPEEVDALKKQCRALTSRIEQTRHNLAIQSKYRDAAISMSKLYSTPDKVRSPDGTEKRHRLSFLGSRGSHPEQVKEAELERLTSERKCEELANELWSLEKRLIDPQKRLLQHTAGILQMTHKGPMKVPKTNVLGMNGAIQQGIPGSPESMYTYTNGRSSMEPVDEEDLFDERSLYRVFDRMDSQENQRESWGLGGRSPSRSPARSKEMAAEHFQAITNTEQRLQDLNNRLLATIVKSNPQLEKSLSSPPQLSADEDSAPGTLLFSHLNYLEQSIGTLDGEQKRLKEVKRDSDIQIEETLEGINCEIRALLLPYNPDIPSPPEITGGNAKEQLQHFQSTIGYIESELQYLAAANDKKVADQENLEKIEAVLRSLWDTIERGGSQQRQAGALGDEENDISGDEPLSPAFEPFSIQAFSGQVQRLYAKAISLNDQKEVLQRQIKQQRELNNKTEGAKDARVLELEDELDRTQTDLQAAEREAQDLQAQLLVTMKNLDEARQEDSRNSLEKSRKEDESTAVIELGAKLQESNSRIAMLEDELQDLEQLETQLQESNSRIARLEEELQDLEQLEARLQESNSQVVILEKELQESHDQGTRLEEELQESNSQIARLDAKLQESNSQIFRLEEDLQDLKDDDAISNAEVQSRLAMSESKIANLNSDLVKAEEEAVKLRKQIEEKENEIEHANMEIARLQTDVTIARAELDGAYGTRAQRAAEVASNPVIQKEIDDLTKRNKALQAEIGNLKASGVGQSIADLKRELSETIEEYEEMTKASIEWEKDREVLERDIDKLRDEKECLETKLSDEQVRWLGMKSPGPDSSNVGAGATSTMVLKNEFKKMMRDTRAENARALRAEQAERRRLEDELRLLKKAQGPGKSGLSRSVTSPS